MMASDTAQACDLDLTTYMPSLMAYAKNLTRNPEAAQDLVQETVMHALRHKDRIAMCDHPERYLAIMLRNLNITLHRKTRAELQNVLSDDLSLPSGDAPAPALQTCREVLEAVEDLPQHYGEILLLSAYEGLSYRELAEHLDIPLGTVMSRLHRARSSLRRVIELEDHELMCDIFAA